MYSVLSLGENCEINVKMRPYSRLYYHLRFDKDMLGLKSAHGRCSYIHFVASAFAVVLRSVREFGISSDHSGDICC